MKCPVCQFEPPTLARFIRLIIKTRVPDTRVFAIKVGEDGMVHEDMNCQILICPKCGSFLGDTSLLELS